MKKFRRLAALFLSLFVIFGMSFTSSNKAFAASTYTMDGTQEGFRVAGTRGGQVPTALLRLSGKNGDALQTYCIQRDVEVSRGTAGYREGSWQTSGVKNLTKVQYLLNHSYPTVGAGELAASLGVKGPVGEKAAIAATQAAIWHYTDGFDLKSSEGGQVVGDLYAALLAAADKNGQAEPPAHRVITVPAGGDGSTLVGPVKVESSDNKPVQLTVSGPAEFVLADGTPVDVSKPVASGTELFVKAPAKAGSVTLKARSSATVEAGRVFVHTGSQTLIVATKATVCDEAEATVTWADAKAPTPTPVPTTTPTASATGTPVVTLTTTPVVSTPATTTPATTVARPTTSAPATPVVEGAKPGHLPNTGGESLPLTLAGVLALAGGAALIVRKK